MQSESKPEKYPEYAEVDPTGRYGRYNEILGRGASKTVYKAFDELEGLEVAWNQLKVSDIVRKSDDFERFQSEIHLLQTLKHKNIIKFYRSWVDAKRGNVNFITEVFTSGTLRQYREKHKRVEVRALKKWSRQILSGLDYLHSHDPPVIHRDLKCDNIFVNGNQGELKIGDLGLAAILQHAHSAHSVIGTPEFMAPELYEEEYNELVDIYAFGMCLLELVTLEYPYMECVNAAQIYKKVTSGIKPASLAKVKDPEVKQFIEKCIANVSERLPARELLMDPFLQLDAGSGSVGRSVRPASSSADNGDYPPSSSGQVHNGIDHTMVAPDFTVEGQRRDINTIFLKLRIVDSTGQVRNIHFPFDIENDTSISVATEMVAELDLSDQDVTSIAEMIDSEIRLHVPEWISGEPLYDNHDNEMEDADMPVQDELPPLPSAGDNPSSGFVLERLPSGRRYWSDSPKGNSISSPSAQSQQNLSSPVLSNLHVGNDVQVSMHDGLNGAYEHDDHRFSAKSNTYSLNQHRNQNSSERSEVNPEVVARASAPKPFLLINDNVAGEEQEGIYDIGGNQREENAYSHVDEEAVNPILQKLKQLLFEQQKELDKLKKKHEMAVADVLMQLSPNLHDGVLKSHRLRNFSFKTDSKGGKHTGDP